MSVNALATANRAQLRAKLEGEFPTNYGVLQAGNGFDISYTGESLKFDTTFVQSKILRSDRQVSGNTPTGASAAGGINVEHRYAGLDPFIRSVVGDDFLPFGTGGVGTAVATMNFTGTTIVPNAAGATVNAFSTLRKGQWFSIIPPVGATTAVKDYLKRRAFRISPTVAPTDLLITLDAATPLNTTILGTTMSAGKISSAFLTNGNKLWSYSMEVAHEDVSVWRLYTGMVPSKLMWKLVDSDLVTGSFEFVGQFMTLPNASSMGTPAPAPAFQSANATRGVFDIFENGASITASTYIKTMDISIDGSVRAQTAVGFYGTARVAPGTFKAGGTLEVYLADKAMYQRFLDNAKAGITLPILDEDGNGYIYHFSRCTYTAVEVNATGLDTDAMLKITFSAEVETDVASPNYNKTMAVYRVGVAV